MKKTIILLILLSGLKTFNVAAQEQTVQIKTSAICGDCKKTIETALNYTKGVKKAHLDVDSKMVTVVFRADKTDPDKIKLAISKAGYDADSIPANPKAYARLKDCCKKGGHPE